MGVLLIAQAWVPLPVADDALVFMLGSQPGSVTNLNTVGQCTSCHGGYDPAVEPGHTLEGSMMAQAGRDPLWLACLVVAKQDSIWALGTPNAGDLCIRCHSPSGWLAGRSDPPNLSALDAGQGDFEGLSCAFCHRMVDPFLALEQPDVPEEEPGSLAETKAEATKVIDREVLSNITLFDGSDFFDTTTDLPVNYQAGELTSYIEATSGQFFVDPLNQRRGGRADADPNHTFWYSRFHRSKSMCGTCHDVSNPVLANLSDPNASQEQTAASFYHVERTFSEFQLSAYAALGGSPANPTIAAAGIPHVRTCQDCHMPRASGKLCNKNNVPVRPDVATHELTGGNSWMTGILASVDQAGGNPDYDPYNYDILSGKHSGAAIDIAGLQGSAPALRDGRQHALDNLGMAADVINAAESPNQASVRIINNTGHKLISGFPEGRRMWLNVVFVDSDGNSLPGTEINRYEELKTTTDVDDNEVYVSGGVLHHDRDDLVYEAKLASALTEEATTFHFVLGTSRYKDNRIPPRGFNVAAAPDRHAQPRWSNADAPDYFTADEYAGGYDEVSFPKPAGATGWVATLYYQTTSMEYIEFLRDEIRGTGTLTLSSPTPSGEANAYVVQSDPFFSPVGATPLNGWGDAIWDLWLHNEGCEPVRMAAALSRPSGLEFTQQPDGAHLAFDTIVGRHYQVEASSDLGPGVWTPVGTELVGDGASHEVIDAAATGHARRFYRIVTTAAEPES